MKLGFSQQVLEKSSNIKFHENPPLWEPSCYMRTDGRTDGQTWRICNFANAPKIIMNFLKVSVLELRAFTGLKREKHKNTEMRLWTPLELGAIHLQWKPPFRFRTEYFFLNIPNIHSSPPFIFSFIPLLPTSRSLLSPLQ
jgi:hypothetical protein